MGTGVGDAVGFFVVGTCVGLGVMGASVGRGENGAGVRAAVITVGCFVEDGTPCVWLEPSVLSSIVGKQASSFSPGIYLPHKQNSIRQQLPVIPAQSSDIVHRFLFPNSGNSVLSQYKFLSGTAQVSILLVGVMDGDSVGTGAFVGGLVGAGVGT